MNFVLLVYRNNISNNSFESKNVHNYDCHPEDNYPPPIQMRNSYQYYNRLAWLQFIDAGYKSAYERSHDRRQ